MMRKYFIVLFVLCTFSVARADQAWVEATSPHFSVFTDGGEKRARDVAQRFEQMRFAFGVVFTKVSVNTPPLQIIAFRNNKELRQFSPLYEGKPLIWQVFSLATAGRVALAPVVTANTLLLTFLKKTIGAQFFMSTRTC